MTNDELKTTEPPELEDNPSQGGDIDLDMLLDVPVVMTVEVGRKSLPIRDLLALTPGAVVTFDRSVTEPTSGRLRPASMGAKFDAQDTEYPFRLLLNTGTHSSVCANDSANDLLCDGQWRH